jgi:hypothetical protein
LHLIDPRGQSNTSKWISSGGGFTGGGSLGGMLRMSASDSATSISAAFSGSIYD